MTTALLVSGAALLSGCGGPPGVGKTAPVAGTVTLDGKPISGGSIAFHPDTGKGNTSNFVPASEIDSSGHFSLTTNGKPGAPLGAYKVSISENEKIDSTKPESKSLINKKYSDSAKSAVLIEVVETPAAGAYDFKLTSK